MSDISNDLLEISPSNNVKKKSICIEGSNNVSDKSDKCVEFEN